MLKNKKIVYFCQECGYESAKWMGQCPGCKAWNTFVEEAVSPVKSKATGKTLKPVSYTHLLEPSKRPLLNPTLQLSGIYFMQELRRPVEKDAHRDLRELEEEVLVNLRKSEYLIGMEVSEEDPKKINIPYLKDKQERILQPVFSDVMEFEKFAKGRKMRIAKIPFAKLPEVMMEQAQACVINPMGFNLVLNKEQLKKIIG